MYNLKFLKRLMKCFPGSFINENGDFIAHYKSNTYFNISGFESEIELKCKVIECFSRSAFKTCPFHSNKKNKEFHKFMLNGINNFLGTKFTENDMELIYGELGNSIAPERTKRFVELDYDMKYLEE